MRPGPLFARIFVVTAFSAAGLIATTSAHADEPRAPDNLPCHTYGDLAGQLDNKYHEFPVSMGIQSNGNLLQVFSSIDSGTWTILSIAPSGRTCVVAAGKSWEQFEAVASGPEA